MSLTIDLSPELEQRLQERAAREGRDTLELVRMAVEQWLSWTASQQISRAELLAGIPLRTPADLLELARVQGVSPLPPLETYLGGVWPEEDEVDEFLSARRAWQSNSLVEREAKIDREVTPDSTSSLD
jgi:hypothetical protein